MYEYFITFLFSKFKKEENEERLYKITLKKRKNVILERDWSHCKILMEAQGYVLSTVGSSLVVPSQQRDSSLERTM